MTLDIVPIEALFPILLAAALVFIPIVGDRW
jgi:hypothetical protein